MMVPHRDSSEVRSLFPPATVERTSRSKLTLQHTLPGPFDLVRSMHQRTPTLGIGKHRLAPRHETLACRYTGRPSRPLDTPPFFAVFRGDDGFLAFAFGAPEFPTEGSGVGKGSFAVGPGFHLDVCSWWGKGGHGFVSTHPKPHGRLPEPSSLHSPFIPSDSQIPRKNSGLWYNNSYTFLGSLGNLVCIACFSKSGVSA